MGFFWNNRSNSSASSYTTCFRFSRKIIWWGLQEENTKKITKESKNAIVIQKCAVPKFVEFSDRKVF